MTIIRITDLWKHYDGRDGEGPAALRGTNMEVRSGDIVAIYGRSGSGKTTLLNLLAGLDRPTRGVIEVHGQDLEAMGDKGRTDLRRLRIGFIFQFFNLLPTLTAFENVYLSLELAGKPVRGLAQEALRSVGLDGKGDRYPHELSGGEQQRVAIARAIVKKPTIILADEPTGNLDTRTADQVLSILSTRCRDSGTTLVMATHSPRASSVADRVFRMEDGIVIEEPPMVGSAR
ncbi:MAG: ABC transporter ATP-binding protein [Thermodesulfobacteriota bacterium]